MYCLGCTIALYTGGVASCARAAGNAGEPSSSPQGKGPGVFCPAHPDPVGPAASCVPTQAVTPGMLAYAAPICATWDTPNVGMLLSLQAQNILSL